MKDTCKLNADGRKGMMKWCVLTNISAFFWNFVGFTSNTAVRKV